jgi:hypothetical protein
MAQNTAELHDPHREPMAEGTHSMGTRIAAISGIAAFALGIVILLLQGSVPTLGDSTSAVAKYYSSNANAHRAVVVIALLIAVPIVLFLVGVHRSLRARDLNNNYPWATVFLYSAVMCSATSGLGEALYAILALRGGRGLDSATLRAVNDGSQIANASLGIWLALTIGSVAVSGLGRSTGSSWYRWFSAVAALLGVLSVIDTVTTSDGGVFANVGFAAFVIWILVTSILLLQQTGRETKPVG